MKATVFRIFGTRLQISEFPTGDFGSNRQAVSVETDRPFRSKSAPRCGWVLVPTLANRRCVIHPILLWSAKASTLVIIIVSSVVVVGCELFYLINSFHPQAYPVCGGASSRPAARCGRHCGQAGRGWRRHRSDRRSCRASARLGSA